jgi:hypothetical protein
MRKSRESTSAALVPPDFSLPPYGLVNAENTSYLRKRPVPEGFRSNPKAKRLLRLTSGKSGLKGLRWRCRTSCGRCIERGSGLVGRRAKRCLLPKPTFS